MNSEPLLDIKDLTVSFEADQEDVEITDKVSFQIYPGEIFGLVGESGCGKTVTALALLKLLPIPGGKVRSGRILFKGRDILSLAPEAIRDLRGKDISMIFQEPAEALNPLLTVKRQLMECFDYHAFSGDKEQRVEELLQRVGFPDPKRILAAFPHELSGGMLQRVMIAMALIMRPALIIADEPTTALDVTVQAQIMELLMEMKADTDASILLISHNLGLMAQYATRLAVMYAGRIVEESHIQAFLDEPLHPYTRGLLEALPNLHSERSPLVPIPGQVPQPKEYEAGCRFRGRCRQAFETCVHKPDLFVHGAQKAGHRVEDHRVACFLYGDREAR